MGKKKREHIVFDQTLKPKKSIPFADVNKKGDGKHKISRQRSGMR
ncbi:hypothetical protein EDD76_11271 [Kineothrix alysoides]|jgi:hypothetical protein|uniref:Uncharacterized protein n=1 Tax=Kineothrix alysoides TaxID=1469948 RepID=A0A4R1QXC2_9FIRM|nr:hypothetical protein [Kineothrix alysoides]TCL56244.1 hypothetical protein EDD76_11271 [Kineothrix alysoides]